MERMRLKLMRFHAVFVLGNALGVIGKCVCRAESSEVMHQWLFTFQCAIAENLDTMIKQKGK